MVARTFSAVLHREDDLYVAECPEVGTVSQGYTIEEAVLNLKEATELYLEEFPELCSTLTPLERGDVAERIGGITDEHAPAIAGHGDAER